MFSGIVQTTTQVTHVTDKPGMKSFSVFLDDRMKHDLAIGASVALDGVCFTVVNIVGNDIYFDAVQETLDKTTIGQLKEGSQLNVERSVKVGDEIGGHQVSGHVYGKAKIVGIDESLDNNFLLTLGIPESLIKYTFNKGYIALNGASLTIVNVDHQNHSIQVSLIPETLRQTTFKDKQAGDEVNIEIEQQTHTIVDTIESILASHNKG
ncbi:MAG: riboflavin synthase subunit alpha [Pseudomonadota bacterium]